MIDPSAALWRPVHGGNLSDAALLFPSAPQPWIDCSTGINPDAYPLPAIDPLAFRALPRSDALRKLLGKARVAYGVPSNCAITASAGTQPILTALPPLFAGRCVAILGPTYAEHAFAWRHNPLTMVSSVADLAGADIAVIVRPNNPDSRVIAAAEVLDLAHRMRSHGGLLILDEAYADLTPDGSLLGLLPAGSTLVLRSFGKSYGLAGVRLAFAIGDPDLVERIRDTLGPWPVTGPTIAVGSAALADSTWLETAKTLARSRSAWLGDVLRRNGWAGRGDALLFHAIEDRHCPALHDHLGRHGIFTRRFAEAPWLLRIGLPPGDQSSVGRFEAAFDGFQPA